MREITGYTLVISSTPNGLDYAVDRFIDAGWQPFGSIAIRKLSGDKDELCQPMVKYITERELIKRGC